MFILNGDGIRVKLVYLRITEYAKNTRTLLGGKKFGIGIQHTKTT